MTRTIFILTLALTFVFQPAMAKGKGHDKAHHAKHEKHAKAKHDKKVAKEERKKNKHPADDDTAEKKTEEPVDHSSTADQIKKLDEEGGGDADMD
jgi:hypothetical protein